MFENIIGQGTVQQLQDDILSGRVPPSILFFGPGESGKGSTALELARVLSCETEGAWKCPCSSCEQHRYLKHEDLLVLGSRSFAAEITASSSAFLRNQSNFGAKLMFFRSLRKLQMRFSPVLIEDNSNIKKIVSVLQSFDEKLYEFLSISQETKEDSTYSGGLVEKTSKAAGIEKICNSLVKDALTLENANRPNIPIDYIRRASWWCRLAPNGKHKTLLIENADNMREESRNSLLKLLEEPPDTVSIILTAKRRETIIPTILSRVRPYRFFKRDIAVEKDIIRLVFRDTINYETPETNQSLITVYLESFNRQNPEKLYPLAGWFILSLVRSIFVFLKKNNKHVIPEFINELGKYCAQISETLKLEKSVKSIDIIKTVLSQSKNFEDDSFSRFMKICLTIIMDVMRKTESPECISYTEIFKKKIKKAVNAVDVLNINPGIAFEMLFFELIIAINNLAMNCEELKTEIQIGERLNG
jgi:DNA polymerase-3 subunit gamma/tau